MAMPSKWWGWLGNAQDARQPEGEARPAGRPAADRPALRLETLESRLVPAGTVGQNTFLADFNRDGRDDLIIVRGEATASGFTEVSVFDGASSFQNALLTDQATALHPTDNTWQFDFADYNRDGAADLVGFKQRGTESGRTEVHILDGRENFGRFLIQTRTGLAETAGEAAFGLADFNGDKVLDLYFAKKFNTDTRQLETHILSGRGDFQQFLFQGGSPLETQSADTPVLFDDVNADGRVDVAVVANGSAATTLTVLNGNRDYNRFLFRAETVLPRTGTEADFALANIGGNAAVDLVYIKKFNTASGSTELQAADGGESFRAFAAQFVTGADPVTPPPDTTPPTLTAALVADTAPNGAVNSDGITRQADVAGQVVDRGALASLRAGFGATPDVDVTDALQADGRFTLSATRLAQILGGPLTDGARTLRLQARDADGNASTVATVSFTLDTVAPSTLSFSLDPASDTPPTGDNLTTNATVTLRGTTDAGATVFLANSTLSTVAAADGSFSLANVPLQAGANVLTLRAFDTAGNSREAVQTITRNSTPTVGTALQNITVAAGAAARTVSLVDAFNDVDLVGTQVRINTAEGPVDLQLEDKRTPLTVRNFLTYVEAGDYTDSILHRSVPGFIVQGGGFRSTTGGSGITAIPSRSPVLNEPGILNTRGTIAMAKIGGDPNSATNQWFVNLADNTNLDTQNGGFTVFGTVLGNGMQTVDRFADNSTYRIGNFGSPFNELPVKNFTGNLGTSTQPAPIAAVQQANLATVPTVQVLRQSDSLTYTATSTNSGVASLTVSGKDLRVTFGTTAGTATITVRATDESGAFVETTFNVTVQ